MRFALRSLLRSRAFTLTVLLSLVLGIAVNAAVFVFIEALLLRPLPYRDPAALVAIQDSRRTGEDQFLSPREVADYAQASRVLTDVAVYRGGMARRFLRRAAPQAIQRSGIEVSGNTFSMLGVDARLGRTLTPSDETEQSAVAVISHQMWLRDYGGKPDVLGGTFRVGAQPFTIVGVMPPGFWYPFEEISFWMPLKRQVAGAGTGRELTIVGRLATGATPEMLRAEAMTLGQQFDRREASRNRRAWRSLTLDEARTASDASYFYVLQGLMACVLALACLNVSTLTLARTIARRREAAIRVAIGAARKDIVRLVAIETALLGVAATIMGVFFAMATVRVMVAKHADPVVNDLVLGGGLNIRVVLFGVAIGLLTMLAFGIAPAWHLARGPLPNALNDGGATSAGRRTHRLRSTLTTLQICGSLTLLATAQAFTVAYLHQREWTPSFPVSNLVMAEVGVAQPAPGSISEVLTRVQSLPAVTEVGASTRFIPRGGFVTVRGSATEDIPCTCYSVTPRFFRAMQLPMLSGRALTDGDLQRGAVVVDEAFADRIGGPQSALGKSIAIIDARGVSSLAQVVGVSRSAAITPPSESASAVPGAVYRVDGFDETTRASLVIRLAQPAAVPAFQTAFRKLLPTHMSGDVTSVRTRIEERLEPLRWYALIVAGFGLLAASLAAVGLLGLLMYVAEQRAHEMRIRIAVGADPRQIMWLMFRNGAVMAISGIAAGLAVAAVAMRVLQSQIQGLNQPLAVALLLPTIIMLAVVIASSWWPARRASSDNPANVLRGY